MATLSAGHGAGQARPRCDGGGGCTLHTWTLHAWPTLGTPLAPSMQASLSKVRALRKESAAAHDYNDYGGPTCGGGEDSPAALKPQPPPRPGRELGTKRRR